MTAFTQVSVTTALTTAALLLLSGCGQQSAQHVSSALPASEEVPAAGVHERSVNDITSGLRRTLNETAPGNIQNVSDSRVETRNLNVTPQRILTAGTLDDVKNDDEFRDYVEQAQRAGLSLLPNTLTGWDGRRIEIMVRNSEGKPFQDAIVRVFASSGSTESIRLKYQPELDSADSRRLVATLRTGSDGRTQFLPGIEGNRSDESWDVEIATADGEVRVSQESLTEPEAWWDFTVGRIPAPLPQQLDLALVIDTTGSMGDELEYLKLEISNIATQIKQHFPGARQRFALIVYRDNGDQYITRSFDFTYSLTDFQRKLNDQSASGGGDYPEAMHAALELAGDLSWQDRNTARMMFLVGDAPPHRRHTQRTFEAVQTLRQRDIAIFPVAGSGTRYEAEFAFRTAAFMTMGKYLFLTDHSGIGLPHETPHAAEYNIEWLSAVMLRMIASELSGRDVLPSEILATEETDKRLLSQTAQQYPNAYAHNVELPPRIPFLNAAEWSEIRPLIALTLLLLLALAERCFARRPVQHASEFEKSPTAE